MTETSRIAFTPAPGDIVEFLSDRQTDKGPSSGKVLSADYGNGICVIKHSDTTEEFVMLGVRVEKFNQTRNHPDKKPYWGLT